MEAAARANSSDRQTDATSGCCYGGCMRRRAMIRTATLSLSCSCADTGIWRRGFRARRRSRAVLKLKPSMSEGGTFA